MTANSYASATGRAAPASAECPQSQAQAPRPPRPLSERERARAAETRAAAHALMPEMLPVIKELHELGLIDGWRNVQIEPIQSDGSRA